MNKHQPVIITDGGPWAEHDVVCYTCGKNSAILFLNNGVFYPCDECELNGWRLIQKTKWWQFWVPKRSI